MTLYKSPVREYKYGLLWIRSKERITAISPCRRCGWYCSVCNRSKCCLGEKKGV